MGALDDLIAADFVEIASLSFDQWDEKNQIDHGPQSAGPMCVTKPTGKLEFTLNSVDHLKLDAKYRFDIHCSGTHVGDFVDANNVPGALVQWDFGHPPGLNKQDTGTVTVDTIGGSVTTEVTPRMPSVAGQDCAGNFRSFTVRLESHPGAQNELQLSVSRGVFGDPMKESNIHISATSGIDVAADAAYSVDIVPPPSGCGQPPGPGELASFRVLEYSSAPHVAYHWTVTDDVDEARGVGRDDRQKFDVQLGPTLAPVTISVEVRPDHFQPKTASLVFHPNPDPPDVRQLQEAMCNLFNSLRANTMVKWFRPGDPAEALDARKWTRQDVRAMRSLGHRIIEETTAILEGTASAGGR